MDILKQTIISALSDAGIHGVELVQPPKPELGDYAFACFVLAKENKTNPVEFAQKCAADLNTKKIPLVESFSAAGPYVNVTLRGAAAAELAMQHADQKARPAAQTGKKIMVEFAHPNTHKAFHIGHLRNIVTGESLVRIFENAGNTVVRANYQGDVGLHIAKCLYAITTDANLTAELSKQKTIQDKVGFLGKAYAAGSSAYEESEEAKAAIAVMNKKIYERDPSILDLYTTTRQWSLDYFNECIYKRLGSHFDRLYFESEVFERGKEIVKKNVPAIFKESQGAVIFPGSEFGLHDRVFLNSQGLATYEAKEMALAEKEFGEFKPDEIYHITATEQSEYFKVVIKALEFVFPETKGREKHLSYGFVRLKEGKMSSRLGKVILGEWLIEEVKKEVTSLMKDNDVKDKAGVAETVTLAAIKYALLKTGVSNDIAFDINESISTSGDSGPYLLYVTARIKSILRKEPVPADFVIPATIEPAEKALILELSRLGDVTALAAANADPSQIAKFAFQLAQKFNNFYHDCPVISAVGDVKAFRLALIKATLGSIEHALYLLGIGTVEKM